MKLEDRLLKLSTGVLLSSEIFYTIDYQLPQLISGLAFFGITGNIIYKITDNHGKRIYNNYISQYKSDL